MTLSTVKERLHDYIERADAKKLQAIYTLVGDDTDDDLEIDAATLTELDKRWDKYVSGKSKTYTPEESIANLKKHRQQK